MSESTIAVRYAKALFETADEQNLLEEIRGDADTLLSLDKDVPEFRDLLQSPVLNADQKRDIFSVLFKSKIDDLSLKFVLLMSDNKREAFLPSVCRVFIDMFKQKKGIKSATITTASGLNESTAKKMKNSLEEFFKSTVELNTQTKPELIGGYILRLDDRQLDASVVSQLRKIKKGMDQSVIS